jgi:hypothetical protein
MLRIEEGDGRGTREGAWNAAAVVHPEKLTNRGGQRRFGVGRRAERPTFAAAPLRAAVLARIDEVEITASSLRAPQVQTRKRCLRRTRRGE